LAVVTAADEEKEAAIARLNAEVARLSAALAATTERLERTEEEKHNVRERLKEEEVKHHLESVKVARAAEALKEADAKADALQRTFAALKVRLRREQSPFLPWTRRK
jgi:benzoyl-CoA reductase/2-hydroxyglutaryl-CoA dehydratase subunit BcrC/BadD/HgdB